MTPAFAAEPPKTMATASHRHIGLVAAVVALHAGGLYALQKGLLLRAADAVIPIEVLARIVEPQPLQPLQPLQPPKAVPQPTPAAPQAKSTPPVLAKAHPLPPAPILQAAASAAPSPNAVTGATNPQPPGPQVAAAVTATTPAAPHIQLPDSNAEYLNNKPPPYPPISKRLGEQGKVVVRVFIDIDGKARQAEIRSSSGFARLDQIALKTTQEWTYVPGKVNGEPQAMWFNVPLQFVLQ